MLHTILPLLLLTSAQVSVPAIVVVDVDDTIATTPFNSTENAGKIINAVLAGYPADQQIPEVLSVWYTFEFNGNPYQTNYVPLGNDIEGIGLETVYGQPVIFDSGLPPLRAMLLHNDLTQLATRAALDKAPAETEEERQAYADQLFLLELSHLWGPQVRVTGEPADRLIGFDFHWSFFLQQRSPAGGNPWVDNGDGTFTTVAAPTYDKRYSVLDLYLMGLATPDEVPPFVLLTDPVVPATAIDPFRNAPISAASFPWQGPDPLTITATAQTLTIDDVITANGARVPAAADAQKEFTVGVVIVAPSTATPDEIAALQVLGGQRAVSQEAAFAAATGGRGTLRTVSSSLLPEPPPATADDAPRETDVEPQTANCSSGMASSMMSSWLALAAAAGWRRRKR